MVIEPLAVNVGVQFVQAVYVPNSVFEIAIAADAEIFALVIFVKISFSSVSTWLPYAVDPSVNV
jgi:hypothetical protein